MTNTKRIVKGGFLLGLIGVVFGCVVEPAEGYYDRDQHRYYHEHHWHQCGPDHDDYCR